jgi:hypothetical protein
LLCRPVIVFEHSAEALSASDRSVAMCETAIRNNEQITDALMVPLAMIVDNELPNGLPQRAFSEQNHPLQAGFFDTAHEAFGVAVQVRRSRRQLHRFHAHPGDPGQKLRRE